MLNLLLTPLLVLWQYLCCLAGRHFQRMPVLRLMLWRMVILLGLLMLLMPLAIPLAHAHSRLLRAEPAAGATLAASPTSITLYFSAPIEPAFSRIELLQQQWQVLPNASIQGKRLQAPLPRLPAGQHQLRWTIMSSDGHHQTGTLSFTIKPPAEKSAEEKSASPDKSDTTNQAPPAKP